MRNEWVLFALNGSRGLGERIGRALGVELSDHEERAFEDGEHKARPLVDVAGRDALVVHGLYGETGGETGGSAAGQSPNDKLCRLLFFLAAVRDAGAARVTAVTPYLCYGRKERRTKWHDPVTTRYVAMMFEAMGVDAVMTLDVHNQAAFENAFRCRTHALEATPLFAEFFARAAGADPLAVVSPDAGGIKRAERFRQALQTARAEAAGGAGPGEEAESVSSAFMEKQRSEGVVTGEALVGDVAGRTAIIFDDLIATGGTLTRAAAACQRAGATRVFAAATHGLFVGGAEPLMSDANIEKIVVTDVVPPFRLAQRTAAERLVVLESGELLAEAIRRARGS